MSKKLTVADSKKILGLSGANTHTGSIRTDEFLPELKGQRAIKTFREMRDNDSTIGAVMYATEQVLRDVNLSVVPADESDEAKVEADFIESVLEDMDHTLDDHISESLSALTYGFAWFEVVYKRRVGPTETSLKKKSKFSDGRIGVRKIAARAPWTINKFEVDQVSGDILGVYQNSVGPAKTNFIPTNKSLYYRTTTINNDPSGRSILRNAYTSYKRLKGLQDIEAIGVERELAGIPVGRVPADYLSVDATDDQKGVLEEFKRVLRDVKFNEQGYLILPSDLWLDKEGSPTQSRLIDVELMASSGTRNIDIDPIIKRYQHDIARSVLSEFLMLGGGTTGSYALSKSKTDLFLRALESYIQAIVDVLNKQLVERLWELNGLDFKLKPTIVAGDVAPHDLKELGAYLRNLNGADISLADQTDIVNALLLNAELPTLDEEVYAESRERSHQSELARADYYDGPDNNIVGGDDVDDNVVGTPEKEDVLEPKKKPTKRKGNS